VKRDQRQRWAKQIQIQQHYSSSRPVLGKESTPLVAHTATLHLPLGPHLATINECMQLELDRGPSPL
jgi:hypothetical protein